MIKIYNYYANSYLAIENTYRTIDQLPKFLLLLFIAGSRMAGFLKGEFNSGYLIMLLFSLFYWFTLRRP